MGNLTLTLLFLGFMSVVFVIYMLVPKKARPYILLVFSLAFYIVYSKFMTVFLVATIVSIFVCSTILNKLDDKFQLQKEGLEKEERKKLKEKFKKKKRLVTSLFIVFNLLILVILKYFNFLGSIFEGFFSWFNLSVEMPILKLALPLGISYYTLSAIGYMIDVCRGKYRGGNFLEVALFISYFPQLYEGPIATFDKLSPQLMEGKGFDSNNFFSGLLTVLWGFFKKIVIADRLAIVVSAVFNNYASYNSFVIFIGILLFTFQLYAEFSGLIDVASGISEMFSIKLAKNFDQPFFSKSVSEFWRRWHISLGAWFREYIFYPISMSKGFTKMNKKLQGKANPFWQVFIPSSIALLVVWFTTGLWHGAELKYVVYGLYYYVIMMIGMLIEPLLNWIYSKLKINKDNWFLKTLRVLRTFILVNIGLLIFRADNLTSAFEMFKGVFTNGGELNLITLNVIDIYDTIWCAIGIAILIVVDVLNEVKKPPKELISKSNTFVKCSALICIALLIFIFGAYGEGYIPPDPIYGGF